MIHPSRGSRLRASCSTIGTIGTRAAIAIRKRAFLERTERAAGLRVPSGAIRIPSPRRERCDRGLERAHGLVVIGTIDEDRVGEREGRAEHRVPADLRLGNADEVAPQQRAEQERVGAALMVEDEDRGPQREVLATADVELHAALRACRDRPRPRSRG